MSLGFKWEPPVVDVALTVTSRAEFDEHVERLNALLLVLWPEAPVAETAPVKPSVEEWRGVAAEPNPRTWLHTQGLA